MRFFLRTATAILLCLPSFGFFTCGPPADPPSSDVCAMASTATISELDAINLATGEPMVEGGVLSVTGGSQGGEMMGLNITYTTTAPVACFEQSARLLDADGNEIVSSTTSLNTYADGSGGEQTGALWLIPPGASFGTASGREATLVIEAYGQRYERHGWLGYMPDPGI